MWNILMEIKDLDCLCFNIVKNLKINNNNTYKQAIFYNNVSSMRASIDDIRFIIKRSISCVCQDETIYYEQRVVTLYRNNNGNTSIINIIIIIPMICTMDVAWISNGSWTLLKIKINQSLNHGAYLYENNRKNSKEQLSQQGL